MSEEFPKADDFMLYATFCGDVERTAHALSVEPEEVIRRAREGKWDKKLRGILELKKSSRPGDVERAVNRAINFVQAHKLRVFFERLLQKIYALKEEELDNYLLSTHTDSDGCRTSKLSTRPLADLAVAFEKCHAMTYLALNDSATERKMREGDPSSEPSGGELHAKIAEAMSRPRQLEEMQEQQAKKS